MTKPTPTKKLKEYVGNIWSFKTKRQAQAYIRKNGAPDYIAIAGILYTMEEFDEAGRSIVYHNIRTDLGFFVTTANRYEFGFGDSIVEPRYKLGCYRNGFVYAD